MHTHNHHHSPRPPFDGPRRGHHDPFAGPGPRGHHDPFAGPGPRGRRGGFPGAGGFDPQDAPRGGFDPQDAPRVRRGRFGGGAAGSAPTFGPGFGPGAPFGPGFGPGRGRGFGPEGPRGRGGHRRRAGRGDIRAAILLLLAEQPRHGYELIGEIAERTEGAWRPSPGAIYPALQLLADEGLVTITAEGGRRLATLSEAGRAYVTAHADELGDPFGDATARTPRSGRALRETARALMGATAQVAQAGDEAQAARAQAILERATKDLYLLLAGETPASAAPTDPAPTAPTPDTTPES